MRRAEATEQNRGRQGASRCFPVQTTHAARHGARDREVGRSMAGDASPRSLVRTCCFGACMRCDRVALCVVDSGVCPVTTTQRCGWVCGDDDWALTVRTIRCARLQVRSAGM